MQVLVSVYVRYGNSGISHECDLRRNLFFELLQRKFSGQRAPDHLTLGKKLTLCLDESRSGREGSALAQVQMNPEARVARQGANTLQGIRSRWHVGHYGRARKSPRFDASADAIGNTDRFPEIVGVNDQREAVVPVLQALVTRWWRR